MTPELIAALVCVAAAAVIAICGAVVCVCLYRSGSRQIDAAVRDVFGTEDLSTKNVTVLPPSGRGRVQS